LRFDAPVTAAVAIVAQIMAIVGVDRSISHRGRFPKIAHASTIMADVVSCIIHRRPFECAIDKALEHDPYECAVREPIRTDENIPELRRSAFP
jgi:hypothetical protein